jgi:glycosyltransferase involved in cell wall biosynthesis
VLLSVVVPSYNYGRYLRDCICSVLRQEFTDWEMLVVDDGSTDDSLAIASCFVELDSRVRLLRQENRGFPSAHNLGLGAVKGEYVLFLDADDFLLKQTSLTDLIGAAGTWPEAVALWGDGARFRDGRHAMDYRRPFSPGLISGVKVAKELLRGDFIPLGSLAVRQDVARKAGFDERVPWLQDWPYKMRSVLQGPCVYVRSDVLSVRDHEGSVAKAGLRLATDSVRTLDLLKEELSAAGLRSDWRAAVGRCFYSCGREEQRLHEWKASLRFLSRATRSASFGIAVKGAARMTQSLGMWLLHQRAEQRASVQ